MESVRLKFTEINKGYSISEYYLMFYNKKKYC